MKNGRLAVLIGILLVLFAISHQEKKASKINHKLARQSREIRRQKQKLQATKKVVRTDPQPLYQNDKIIGRWRGARTDIPISMRQYITYTIYKCKSRNKVKMHQLFKDGSSGNTIMDITYIGKTTITNPDNPGDYFIINSRRDLEVWDKIGKIYTAKKIPIPDKPIEKKTKVRMCLWCRRILGNADPLIDGQCEKCWRRRHKK